MDVKVYLKMHRKEEHFHDFVCIKQTFINDLFYYFTQSYLFSSVYSFFIQLSH